MKSNLSQLNPVDTTTKYFFKINVVTILEYYNIIPVDPVIYYLFKVVDSIFIAYILFSECVICIPHLAF